MAKKYIIRSFNPGKREHNKVNTLLNLSSLGINTAENIIQSSQSLGVTQTDYESGAMDSYINVGPYESRFSNYRDITKNQSSSYAFFDLSYRERRDYLRQFAQSNEISFILDTISNEAIVNDSNGYFAHLDIDRLKMNINKDYKDEKTKNAADDLIRDCQISFDTVYSCFGWDKTNDAWNYFRKFLIDGYLAFEIIFDYNENNQPTSIICFKELDPCTLEPDIHIVNGKEVQVWYQYRGDASREHIIPDSNIIYISWTTSNFQSNTRISYLEGLTRSYNMLRQLENSHLIWNIQNSQKRMKITVPVGGVSESKARQRVSEMIADYNEEVTIDDTSGEVVINGQPKFSWQKTYVFADREGSTPTIEEISTEGYDMNTTDSLQYYWRKFILESQVPANRFTLNISSPPSNNIALDASITREEYAFNRFIQRIQSVYKEILLKPVYIQLCLKHPELSYVDYLRQCLGIVYNDENLFTLAKRRAIVEAGANTVQTLYGLQDAQQKPVFAINFLIKEYLGLTDEDIKLNNAYKEQEVIAQINLQKLMKKSLNKTASLQNNNAPAGGGGGDMGGFDTGGFDDMGSDNMDIDMGTDDMGGFDMDTDNMDMDMGSDMGMDTGTDDMGGFDTGGETPEA